MTWKYIYQLIKAMTLIGFGLSTHCFAAEEGTVVATGGSNYPPFNWFDTETNQFEGASVEMTKALFASLDIPLQIKHFGPWKRVLRSLDEGQADMVMSIYLTSEREASLSYSRAYRHSTISVFVRQDNTFPFEDWQDLIGKSGDALSGARFGTEFDFFLKNYLKVERTSNLIHQIMKLERGRTDYALISHYPGILAAVESGYLSRIKTLPVQVNSVEVYMAFSQKSKYIYLLPEVNRILKDFQDSDRIQAWTDEAMRAYRNKLHSNPLHLKEG